MFSIPQPKLEKKQLPQLRFVAIEALYKARQPFLYALAIHILVSRQSHLARLRKHLGCKGKQRLSINVRVGRLGPSVENRRRKEILKSAAHKPPWLIWTAN